MLKTFEIHDLTTNEILADNLDFDDMPELLDAYQNFYADHEIIACYRNFNDDCKPINLQKNDFIIDWFALIEANLCNIY